MPAPTTDSDTSLPAAELRQGMLRRAQITLAEARALLFLLDHIAESHGQARTLWHVADRAALGLQPFGPTKLLNPGTPGSTPPALKSVSPPASPP